MPHQPRGTFRLKRLRKESHSHARATAQRVTVPKSARYLSIPRMNLRLLRVVVAGCVAATCAREERSDAQHGAPQLGGVVEFVIGDSDGSEGPHAFSDVRGLALDSHGRLFVADSKASQVYVFS